MSSDDVHERVAEKERLLGEMRHQIERLRRPSMWPPLVFIGSVLAFLWALFQMR
jgi:hypothetical protein